MASGASLSRDGSVLGCLRPSEETSVPGELGREVEVMPGEEVSPGNRGFISLGCHPERVEATAGFSAEK